MLVWRPSILISCEEWSQLVLDLWTAREGLPLRGMCTWRGCSFCQRWVFKFGASFYFTIKKEARGSLLGLVSRKFCLSPQRFPPSWWFPKCHPGNPGVLRVSFQAFAHEEVFLLFLSFSPKSAAGSSRCCMMCEITSDWIWVGESSWLIQARHQGDLQKQETLPHFSLNFFILEECYLC